MSRSGYIDDWGDEWGLIMWRGAVTSAIRGRRGQAFLRELRDALDALPVKQLIADQLVVEIPGIGGSACALGTVALKRGINTKGLDPYDSDTVAATFGIAPALAREIVFMNDELGGRSAEMRWAQMRSWVEKNIKKTPTKQQEAP